MADEKKLDQKLDASALDDIAGGTVDELSELVSAMQNSGFMSGIMKGASHIPAIGIVATEIAEKELDERGIKANISVGFAGTGIGSSGNTYVVKRTGEKMTHAEVLEFIKSRKASI